jgi:RNA polymerase sigma factor (sigma-70 family)
VSTAASKWTDARLVRECLDGNEQAWNVLVDRYKNLIFSIPIRQGAAREDAADIFQSVCIDLFHELPRIRDVEALRGWLIRVTTHRSYRWMREQSARSNGEFAGEIHEDPGETPPDVVAEIEREEMLREALGQLESRCRKMIEMLFFEQPPLPYAEVARRLNLAAGSIGFIRGRCLKRLRKILEEKGF